MTALFVNMITQIFRGPLAVDAAYHPAVGERRILRAVVTEAGDADLPLGGIGAVAPTIRIDVMAADFTAGPPLEGDRIVIGDAVHRVRSARLDAERLVWRLSVTVDEKDLS